MSWISMLSSRLHLYKVKQKKTIWQKRQWNKKSAWKKHTHQKTRKALAWVFWSISLNTDGRQSGENKKDSIYNPTPVADCLTWWRRSCNGVDSHLMRDNRSPDCNAFWVATKECEAMRIWDQLYAVMQTVFSHYAPMLEDANTFQHCAKQIQQHQDGVKYLSTPPILSIINLLCECSMWGGFIFSFSWSKTYSTSQSRGFV